MTNCPRCKELEAALAFERDAPIRVQMHSQRADYAEAALATATEALIKCASRFQDGTLYGVLDQGAISAMAARHEADAKVRATARSAADLDP